MKSQKTLPSSDKPNDPEGARPGAVPLDERRRIAQAVRQACLQAALQGYEQGGLAGLCAEGRWEMAVDAMQALDLDAILQDPTQPKKLAGDRGRA